MATIQSGIGRIRMFEDFLGAEHPIALQVEFENIGPFKIGGEGIEEEQTYAGGAVLDSDGLSGIIQLTTDDENLDTALIKTAICFDAGLMGTLVLETRVRFTDLTAKAAFVGFSDTCADDADFATDIIDYSAVTTVSYVVSNLCGFYLSSEFTDDEDWHAVYKGGTATAVTATGSIDLDDDAVATEFQILRLEVDNNGTARWYIDGVLLKTLEGAMSTTTDMCAVVGVTANAAADVAVMDVDYILVEANRDWTV